MGTQGEPRLEQAADRASGTDAQPSRLSGGVTRRGLLKAGVVAAPLILTLRGRPVLGQIGNHISGLSGASKATP